MTDDELLKQLHDSANEGHAGAALTLTAIGEARGDDADGSSLEERVAVMCAVRNRMMDEHHRFGQWWGDVIFAPKQFSCWNENDSNRRLLLQIMRGAMSAAPAIVLGPATFALWKETAAIAALVLDGSIVDRTGGATHYYAPKALEALGLSIPSWALGQPYKQVGSQRFFRL